MNKKISIFLVLVFAVFFFANAQSGYGIKGGVSYNSNGKLSEIISDTQTNLIDNKGAGKSGYNIGFYGKLDLGSIYIRPELVYTNTTSEYTLNNNNSSFKLSKLDLPVLIGIPLIGPLDIFAGPSFQYILENKFNYLDYKNIKNDYTVGLNIGASVELGRLGLDVRYERGFSSNEAEFMEQVIGGTPKTYQFDTRPEQFIFSISYRLSSDKTKN